MADERTILVVDDNEMNRDMIGRRLQRQGFSIATANDGQTALDMLRADRYALLLLDVMMPNLSGYEVLKIVKADDALRHLPVIMISALDDLDSVVQCIELGADDYLFKPFNPVLLKARVTASLRRAEERVAAPDVESLRDAINALRVAVNALDDHVEDAETLQGIHRAVDQMRALLSPR